MEISREDIQAIFAQIAPRSDERIHYFEMLRSSFEDLALVLHTCIDDPILLHQSIMNLQIAFLVATNALKVDEVRSLGFPSLDPLDPLS